MKKIRKHNELKDFLRPISLSTYITDLPAGPIVVVNVHSSCCDALIILDGVSQHLPLPNLSEAQVEADVAKWQDGLSLWKSHNFSDRELERQCFKPVLRTFLNFGLIVDRLNFLQL